MCEQPPNPQRFSHQGVSPAGISQRCYALGSKASLAGRFGSGREGVGALFVVELEEILASYRCDGQGEQSAERYDTKDNQNSAKNDKKQEERNQLCLALVVTLKLFVLREGHCVARKRSF